MGEFRVYRASIRLQKGRKSFYKAPFYGDHPPENVLDTALSRKPVAVFQAPIVVPKTPTASNPKTFNPTPKV